MKNKPEKDAAKKVLDQLTETLMAGIDAVKSGEMGLDEALTIVRKVNAIQNNYKTLLMYDHVDIQYLKADGRESALKRKDRELELLENKLSFEKEKWKHQIKETKPKK